jgi:anthranilate phosphoribosyltransferase
VGGTAASVREGIERASQAIDSGAVRTKLDAMIAASRLVAA